MVHDTISQRKGEDHKGCITACAIQTDTHVQLPRVQRCAGFISTGTNSAASHHILANEKLCSIDSKVVYRRYASLFFIAGCASTDNELITLEIVHRYVEQMDKYYGNVCELDIIFNFQKAYFILDELLLAGEMQESSKKNVLRCISQEDSLEDMEVSREKSPCRLVSKSISNIVVPRISPICPPPCPD
jgi:Clathrin adaptor complex small chain